jgi:hypothetical protein
MNQRIVVKEVAPSAWTISVLSPMGAVAGRSSFPTASQAAGEARKANPDALIVVQLVADDRRIPDEIRVVLSLLQQHGYAKAGRKYSISRHQLDEMGLTASEIHALSSLNIPHLGRSAAIMTSQNVPARGDAELQLVCDLV